MKDTVVISHGNEYKEVTLQDYEENYSDATDEHGGWALLGDQEHGRAALAYQEARDGSPLGPEEFGRQALAFVQAIDQSL